MKRIASVTLTTVAAAAAMACGGSPAPANRTAHAAAQPSPETVAVPPASNSGVHSVVAPDSAQGTPEAAAVVLRSYLTALRAHDSVRQAAEWEPGTSDTSGARRLRGATIAAFIVGTPGGIEGAAGSRYIEIPVTLDLATPSPQRLRGVATLRRAVVDGATAAQRHWRIMRLEWGAPTPRTSRSSDSAARR